jgi:hypothetical protein
MPGFRPRRTSHFGFDQSGQTHVGRGMGFGGPARFTDTGGWQTRLAQTLPAFSPLPVARLGHATRPEKLKGKAE